MLLQIAYRGWGNVFNICVCIAWQICFLTSRTVGVIQSYQYVGEILKNHITLTTMHIAAQCTYCTNSKYTFLKFQLLIGKGINIMTYNLTKSLYILMVHLFFMNQNMHLVPWLISTKFIQFRCQLPNQ